nr:hypothetical protein [uncultured Allomuricauda sp.]
MSLSDLTQRINESIPLDFGSIFNNSIELFKKVWVQGFITLLFTFLALIPFYVLLYAPMIAFGISDPEAMNSQELPPAVILFMVLFMPIFFLGLMTIVLCLNAAFLRICRLKDLNEPGEESYFFYFKRDYLGKALLLSLIMLGLSILGTLACGLGIIYLMVPMSLFPAFLAFDKELKAMEITKASFALGNKNWLVIFGLIIVTGIIAQLGFLLCVVGVLFTAMFGKIPVYFIYKDAVGFSSMD